MQSLNRLKSNRPRHERDFYETPSGLCTAALKRWKDDFGLSSDYGYVGLDAGSGNGVWGKSFRKVFCNRVSYGVDIHKYETEDIYDKVMVEDFLSEDFVAGKGYDLVYGNPPYSHAEEFVRQGLKVGQNVYFLFRLAFLETKKRYFGLFKDHPPRKVYVLSRRPSFFRKETGNIGTDATAYAMFYWKKGYEGKPDLDWMYWEYDD